MVLLTDECLGTQKNRDRKPSISLAFQPSGNTFNFQFRTELTEINQNVTGAQPVGRAGMGLTGHGVLRHKDFSWK